MGTDQQTATADVAGVLAQMHVLLWQASTEAAARASADRTLEAADLANDLTYACDQVFHLVPVDHRALLLGLPAVPASDPVQLARAAEQLAHTLPDPAWPPGLELVVRLLKDTLSRVS